MDIPRFNTTHLKTSKSLAFGPHPHFIAVRVFDSFLATATIRRGFCSGLSRTHTHLDRPMLCTAENSTTLFIAF